MIEYCIRRTSLLHTLNCQIKEMETKEKKAGCTAPSTLLTELKETFDHVSKGGQLYIMEEDQ